MRPVSYLYANAQDAKITLYWEEVDTATYYNVYYGTSTEINTSSTKITTVDTEVTILGLTNGLDYYIKVAAANFYGESPLSDKIVSGPDKWTPLSLEISTPLHSVRYLGESLGFWIIGEKTTILQSNDGLVWNTIDLACTPESPYLYDIASDNQTKLRIVGSSGTLIESDDAGSSWNCSKTLPESGGISQKRILYTGSDWWVAGNIYKDGSYFLMTGHSTNGSNWLLFAGNDARDYWNDLSIIEYNPIESTIYMFGNDEQYALCPGNCDERVNWTFTETPWSSSTDGASYYNSTWYISSYNDIYSDSDLDNLKVTEKYLGYSTLTQTNSILYSVGKSGRIYSLSKAKNWVYRYNENTENLNEIACSPDRCVIIGESGTILYR